jgi:hypothetical protein
MAIANNPHHFHGGGFLFRCLPSFTASVRHGGGHMVELVCTEVNRASAVASFVTVARGRA